MCDHEKSSEESCGCKVERVPNFVQPRVLLELAKKPAHGYELIEHLNEGWGAAPDPGNLYRVLRLLEDDGLVCSNWDTQNTGPARRVYELTDQGLDFLHAWAVTINQTHQSLGRFLSDYQNLFPK
jgi:PadR family transcriptional regulator, regulatory protein PadR